jgi:nucleolar protein 15
MPSQTKTTRKRTADLLDTEGEQTTTKSKGISERNTSKKRTKTAEIEPIGTANEAKRDSKRKQRTTITNDLRNEEVPEVVAPQNNSVKAKGNKQEDEFEGFDDEVDNETAALLEGFDSSGDEVVVEQQVIDQIPSVPTNKALSKKLAKASVDTDEPGVVYVGYCFTKSTYVSGC